MVLVVVCLCACVLLRYWCVVDKDYEYIHQLKYYSILVSNHYKQYHYLVAVARPRHYI